VDGISEGNLLSLGGALPLRDGIWLVDGKPDGTDDGSTVLEGAVDGVSDGKLLSLGGELPPREGSRLADGMSDGV